MRSHTIRSPWDDELAREQWPVRAVSDEEWTRLAAMRRA
jgi:hypothetical protein